MGLFIHSFNPNIEITKFGHEMLLCKADDQDLIKVCDFKIRLDWILLESYTKTCTDKGSYWGHLAKCYTH